MDKRSERRRFAAALLAASWSALKSRNAEGEDMPEQQPSTGHFNAVTPTLGGRQLWADELFFHGWHIQRHALTGHCRLLDGGNHRHGWGSFGECQAKLEQIKSRRALAPMQGSGVVVLHGLFRSAASMGGMSRYLQEQGNLNVFNVNYPTTRGSIAEHAASLDKVVRSLEGLDDISFVAHSLGNLVIRHWLADRQQDAAAGGLDPRIKRMVMLGPPNNGAQMAEYFANNWLFHQVAGRSAGQLARDWENLEPKLCTPPCEFGIISGGRKGERGYNPWLLGDNDLVVSVDSTRLAGATDSAVLNVIHTLMMDDATVQQYTLRFLRHGHFISAEQRQPIAALTVPS